MLIIGKARGRCEVRGAYGERKGVEGQTGAVSGELHAQIVGNRRDLGRRKSATVVAEPAGVLAAEQAVAGLKPYVVQFSIKRSLRVVVIDLAPSNLAIRDLQIEESIYAIARSVRWWRSREIAVTIGIDAQTDDGLIEDQFAQMDSSVE